jgi:hypothetical protein
MERGDIFLEAQAAIPAGTTRECASAMLVLGTPRGDMGINNDKEDDRIEAMSLPELMPVPVPAAKYDSSTSHGSDIALGRCWLDLIKWKVTILYDKEVTLEIANRAVLLFCILRLDRR